MEQQDKKIERIIHNHNSAELPSLCISLTESTADFVKQHLYLEARGRDISEAIAGLEYLLSIQGRVKKN